MKVNIKAGTGWPTDLGSSHEHKRKRKVLLFIIASSLAVWKLLFWCQFSIFVFYYLVGWGFYLSGIKWEHTCKGVIMFLVLILKLLSWKTSQSTLSEYTEGDKVKCLWSPGPPPTVVTYKGLSGDRAEQVSEINEKIWLLLTTGDLWMVGGDIILITINK